MERDILKYKALKTKEDLVAWANQPEGPTKIVSVVKDNSNGDWVIWYMAPVELVWQYSTRNSPDVWHDAAADEYETGKDLMRLNWRQIEK